MVASSRDMVRMFRALSDPTRVEIVRLVSASPRNVSELTSIVGVSQPKVSRHLKILRDAGLLDDVRRGKWVWYEMARHSGGEPGSTIATAMSMLFHGGSKPTPRPAPARQSVEKPSRKPTQEPAPTPAGRPARAQALARRSSDKPAPKPAGKPAPKEAPPPRPAAPKAPPKDIEDFLL